VISAIPGLCVPLLLISGIALGYATPTEVSSWAVIIAVIISTCLYRSLSFRGIFDALRRTSDMAGMLLFIFAASAGLSFVLTVLGTSNMIASWVNSLGRHPALFLTLAAIALLVLGAILEGVPALVVLGPLLLPVAIAQGVNLIQFSIVLIVAMGLGSFTPPIGVGIYAACLVTDTKLEPVARRFWPYFAVLFAGLIVLALVPQVSLAL
jgi:tripartite ATP-independent transporter DctM subunit